MHVLFTVINMSTLAYNQANNFIIKNAISWTLYIIHMCI